MFEPMPIDYQAVIIMDAAMVAEYKEYLEAQGQHVDVISMTARALQQDLLDGYLVATGQTN